MLGRNRDGYPDSYLPGAPTEKWHKLFVKNQTQISVVGGFVSLPVFLVKASEAAEHFQALFFTHKILLGNR